LNSTQGTQMTIDRNKLWQQVSLDLRQEVGQARWLSTFAHSMLFEANGASSSQTRNWTDLPEVRLEEMCFDQVAGQVRQASQNKSAPDSSSARAKSVSANSNFQLIVPNKITCDNIVSKHMTDVKRLIAKHTELPDEEVCLEVKIGEKDIRGEDIKQKRGAQDDPLPPSTDFAAALSAKPKPSDTYAEHAQIPLSRHRANGQLSRDNNANGYNPNGHGPSGPSESYAFANSHKTASSKAEAGSYSESSGLYPLNPRFTFDNFVSGHTNRFAYQATLAVAEHPGEHYNPLFIFGNVGLGKTHLLQAAANFVTAYYPQKRIRYVTTETFLNDFLAAIRRKRGDQFREKYRQLDVLILDDIQILEGKESTQEEIFHTFNHLYENRKQLIFSSDRMPDALQTLESRLRSRFKSGLLTDIQPPDIETRIVILAQNVEHHNQKMRSISHPTTEVPQDVLNFIAENFRENVRELEGALTRVLAHATLMETNPTLDFTSELLSDLISHSPSQLPSAQEIIHLATEMFAVTEEELTGKSRKQDLVMPRHITMYAIREHTDLSYPAIGEFFSDRDHSSVMHAVSKVKKHMREKHDIYQNVLRLTGQIKAARRANSYR